MTFHGAIKKIMKKILITASAERLQIEKDFMDALNRLRNNKPNDPDLRQRAVQGKLKINASTLAKEAGRSRTLIGFDGCAYPSVRKEIMQLSKVHNSKKAERVDLSEQLNEALKERDAALFWQADHFQAKEKLERELARTKKMLDDCRNKKSDFRLGIIKLSK